MVKEQAKLLAEWIKSNPNCDPTLLEQALRLELEKAYREGASEFQSDS